MTKLMPLLIALPLGGAFLTPLLGRRRPVLSRIIAAAVTLCGAALSLAAAAGQPGFVVYEVGGWAPPFGISMVLDRLSVFMLVTVNCIAFLVTVYAVDYMKRYTSSWKFYTLFLLMVAGMDGVIITGDMFNLFVFLEIATIASYALVAFGTEHEELEASFKYMVMGSIASSLILIAIAMLYSASGTLNMADLAGTLKGRESSPLMLFVVSLFLAGFGMKAALVPFHAWLPDAHPSAPAPISAMLSGVLIKTLGIYALVRLIFSVSGAAPQVMEALLWLGALSMLVGVLLAIGQWDFKRLLAYHSISQVGYVVLGIGLGTPLGILGGLFHLLNHSVFKSLLFLNSGAVDLAAGTRDLREMGGLRERMPVTAATSFIASMSIAGVPPFNGFWSKLLIILACVESARWGFAAAAVFVSVITLASFMKVQRYAFAGELPERLRNVREVPLLMQLPMVILSLVCVLGGVMLAPSISGKFLKPARDAVSIGTGYADAARVAGAWRGPVARGGR